MFGIRIGDARTQEYLFGSPGHDRKAKITVATKSYIGVPDFLIGELLGKGGDTGFSHRDRSEDVRQPRETSIRSIG